MSKSLIIYDRLMYGALLGMIFFLPYSLALIEICLLTMMLAWAVRQAFFPQRINLTFNSLSWALIAIGALIILTIPFSHCPLLSLKKFFSRFLQQIIVMVLAAQIIHSRKRLYGALLVLLVSLFFVIIDGMFQYFGGKSIIYHSLLICGRVTGPMNHPNDLGTFLVTVLPVILVLIFTVRQWISFLPVLFVLLLCMLGLTASRGAWVAFAMSMIFLGVYLRKFKFVSFSLLILIVLGGVFSKFCLTERTDLFNVVGLQGHSFSKIAETFFSPDGRQSYWEAAIDVIKKYPLFGCGYNAYTQTLMGMQLSQEDTHNSILLITAELGFLGLVLYGWFFTALFIKIRNLLRVLSKQQDLYLIGCGLTAGILAWLVHSFMDTPWSSFQLSILWWLFIGILLSLEQINKGEHRGITH